MAEPMFAVTQNGGVLSRRKFYDKIVVVVVGGVWGFFHVHKISFAVVETIAVDVMTDFSEWCAGNKSVHADVECFAVPGDSGFGVPVVLRLDGSPCEFAECCEMMRVNDRNFSAC